MSTLLPIDDNGNPIAILGFDYRGTQKVKVGNDSARTATPIAGDIEVITIISTGACRFEVGDSSVTADAERSPFLYPGAYIDIPLRAGERFVAFIADGGECDAYVIGRI